MMNKSPTAVDVYMDMYQSAHELLIVLPLGGVEKKSLSLSLKKNLLTVHGTRTAPIFEKKYIPLVEECFWGSFERSITLPELVYFDKIYSELSIDNILTIIVPKVLYPETIPVVIL